ncbi:MAG TPA: helix-turn-helix transcriptional regulator, partial [Gemmatimonadaceae bacterium]
HEANVAITAGFAPDDIRKYEADWAKLDPWARSPAVRRLRSGSVAVGEQLITHAEMKRTAFYNDFGRHYDVVRCITATMEIEERRTSVLSVNRSEKTPEFGPEETALLTALMPHLQRALQIHRRLAASQALADGSTTALDLLAHGVLLLDSAGRVLFANRTAEEILRGRDGLMVHNKELFGARGSDTTTLRTVIAAAVATSGGDGTGAGGLVLVGRPSGRSPLRVLVAPLAQRHPLMGAAGAAASVFITDPERSPVPAAAHLQHAFGLSAAETRVATSLLDGESVEGLSDRLCISRNTARTHLRRLFAKTDTSRQADLIRVLLGAHAPLRFD